MEGTGAGGKPLIHSSEDLRAHFGQLSPLAEKKVLHHLDKFCRDFIALSPFLVLASADSEGRADASPRGDGPGFVQVLDERTLLIPDRRGNNRVDSLGNVLSAPGVGLVFFVPGIIVMFIINYFTGPTYWWALWVLLGWGIGLLAHWWFVLGPGAPSASKQG